MCPSPYLLPNASILPYMPSDHDHIYQVAACIPSVSTCSFTEIQKIYRVPTLKMGFTGLWRCRKLIELGFVKFSLPTTGCAKHFHLHILIYSSQPFSIVGIAIGFSRSWKCQAHWGKATCPRTKSLWISEPEFEWGLLTLGLMNFEPIIAFRRNVVT